MADERETVEIHLTTEQLDVVRKALHRQDQRHRGDPANRYAVVCDVIEAQLRRLPAPDVARDPRFRGRMVLDADNPGYFGFPEDFAENSLDDVPDGLNAPELAEDRVEVMERFRATGRFTKPTQIQTLLFDVEQFTAAAARAWAIEHNFKASKVDLGEGYRRVRQRHPGDFDPDTFETIDIRPGVKAVIGVPISR